MQVVAIDWHVYLLTRSPLALGLLGLVRILPIIAFSLWGGIVADRHDRRWVVFVSQSLMTGTALALAAITWTGRDALGLVYLLTALAAAAAAFDNPARQALIPNLVPREDLPGALSLNLTMFHTAMIAGPGLSGLIIAGSSALVAPPASLATGAGAGTRGIALIYLVNAASFLGVLVVLLRMRNSGQGQNLGTASARHPIAALREGLRFVFTTPIMVWTMALDFFATFFASATALLPIFADQILDVGPVGYGWLRSAPALGALGGSVYASLRALPNRQGRVLLWSVAAYGAATVVFGVSRSYSVTFAALAATGLADLVSTVVRQTLRQLITPDELRGRMISVNMLFYMGGPQLGEVEAGLVAWLFASAATGAVVSVVAGGLATIAVAAFVAARAPVVREYAREGVKR
jgi:MFS family permease